MLRDKSRQMNELGEYSESADLYHDPFRNVIVIETKCLDPNVIWIHS